MSYKGTFSKSRDIPILTNNLSLFLPSSKSRDIPILTNNLSLFIVKESRHSYPD
jgi:hypothetical protein